MGTSLSADYDAIMIWELFFESGNRICPIACLMNRSDTVGIPSREPFGSLSVSLSYERILDSIFCPRLIAGVRLDGLLGMTIAPPQSLVPYHSPVYTS